MMKKVFTKKYFFFCGSVCKTLEHFSSILGCVCQKRPCRKKTYSQNFEAMDLWRKIVFFSCVAWANVQVTEKKDNFQGKVTSSKFIKNLPDFSFSKYVYFSEFLFCEKSWRLSLSEKLSWM